MLAKLWISERFSSKVGNIRIAGRFHVPPSAPAIYLGDVEFSEAGGRIVPVVVDRMDEAVRQFHFAKKRYADIPVSRQVLQLETQR